MQKQTKFLSILLCVMLLGVNFFTPVYASEKEYNKGDRIEFGSYPQELVKDANIIKDLNKETKNWEDMPFQNRIDNSEMINSLPTELEHQYCDLMIKGEKYRAVKSLKDDSVNYFKYIPIEWIVLNPATGYVISADVLDKKGFYNDIEYYDADHTFGIKAGKNSDKDPIDYTTSDLREWLNNDFYDIAFTSIQKSSIKSTKIDNHRYVTEFSEGFNIAELEQINDSLFEAEAYNATEDKIFLISARDYYEYGFDEAKANEFGRPDVNALYYSKASDYARYLGCMTGNDFYYYCAAWWLRSAGGNNYSICNFHPWDGMMAWNVLSAGFLADAELGVRPAMCIDLKNFEINYILGDVDGDSKISASDARLALRASVGLENYKEDSAQYKAANVDSEDKLSAADARLILRASVGLEDPTSWLK